MLFQGDDQLQGVHGIQPESFRTEERSVIANFLRGHLEHQFVHQDGF